MSASRLNQHGINISVSYSQSIPLSFADMNNNHIGSYLLRKEKQREVVIVHSSKISKCLPVIQLVIDLHTRLQCLHGKPCLFSNLHVIIITIDV